MQVVEQAAVIEATMTEVMAALNDVQTIPSWATVPGTISKVQGKGIGMTYNWHFEVSKITFKGKTEVIEQTENSLITRTTGDVESIWTVSLTPIGQKSTAIRVTVEYSLPTVLIEPLADVVLQRLARPEVASENMKRFKQMVEERVKVNEAAASSFTHN